MHLLPFFLTLLPISLTTAHPSPPETLNTLARRVGKLYFGTATDNTFNLSTYTHILAHEFGQLTPANGQKWMYSEPLPGVFNYTYGSIVPAIAASNHQLLRCHTLVWHSQLPAWVENGNFTQTSLTAVIERHVTNLVTKFKGRCYAWDVVNEALNEDGTFRDSVFLRVLGQEFIRTAFRAAAKADPHAKLYYNDYNLEGVNAKTESVRENIIKYLRADNLKIDGVGLQSHLIVGQTPTLDDQIENLKRFERLSVETAYTEVDIRLDLPQTEEQLAQQKVDYRTAVGACTQVKSCVGITVWDFYDPYSWVPGVFDGQGAATLYFANFTKHPAYYGVVEALKNGTKHH